MNGKYLTDGTPFTADTKHVRHPNPYWSRHSAQRIYQAFLLYFGISLAAGGLSGMALQLDPCRVSHCLERLSASPPAWAKHPTILHDGAMAGHLPGHCADRLLQLGQLGARGSLPVIECPLLLPTIGRASTLWNKWSKTRLGHRPYSIWTFSGAGIGNHIQLFIILWIYYSINQAGEVLVRNVPGMFSPGH